MEAGKNWIRKTNKKYEIKSIESIIGHSTWNQLLMIYLKKKQAFKNPLNKKKKFILLKKQNFKIKGAWRLNTKHCYDL